MHMENLQQRDNGIYLATITSAYPPSNRAEQRDIANNTHPPAPPRCNSDPSGR